MAIRNIFCLLSFLLILQSGAETTRALTEAEINERKNTEPETFYGGKFYSRQFEIRPGGKLRAMLPPAKTLKQAFCEALTNNVVRALTRNLRLNNSDKPVSKTVLWQADRKTFAFKYKAVIKDSMIVREECALEFPGLPVLATLNGKMPLSPEISTRRLSRVLYYLKKGNMEIKHVSVEIGSNRDEAEDFVDGIDIAECSDIYMDKNRAVPQIMIGLK
ncbi:MAG: hypothetical protein PHV82_08275 [Victivallaceae bacterium]|nr:hypothetical protein [Victivallaceae bacterium]